MTARVRRIDGPTMTDHAKDREAVEWGKDMLRGSWRPQAYDYMARLVDLAEEALAMRERGVWAWCVEPDDDDEELLPPTVARGGGREAALRHRDEYYPGGRVFPLYAGEPVEVG